MKKVFFFDIDGTLLPHGNQKGVDPKTIYALNFLKEAGHDVVLATGKSESMIPDSIKELSSNNHITMNGAQVVIDNQVKHVERMSRETLESLKQIARENNLMLGCQTRKEYYIVDINFDHQKAEQILNVVSLDVPAVKVDFAEEDVISQLWFLGDPSNLDFDAPIIDGHRLLRWNQDGCDVVIDYVSKAFAIEKYLDLVYPDMQVETYAFGDGQNDIEMLNMVTNGIAMGNAVDSLKAIANEVTDSCEDLGVYNYLLKNKFIEE